MSGAMTGSLTLKRASKHRPGGPWSDDDYDVVLERFREKIGPRKGGTAGAYPAKAVGRDRPTAKLPRQ